jgi:phosphohistidine phosphatase SixA
MFSAYVLPLWRISHNTIKHKVKITLRMEVYRQSVHLGAKTLEAHDQSFFQLNPCGHNPYVTSSLTR